MSVCPNVNTIEWKALEKAVGKFEAYRDFLETGGLIRTPEEVKVKIELRESESVSDRFTNNPSFAEMYEVMAQDHPLIGINLDQLKNSRAVELANKMSQALKVPYEGISEEQAKEITKSAVNPWNGESAFFYGETVYFLQNRMTSDMVFHEFSHPLVRAISRENPELFESLYSQVENTSEGKSIIDNVKENYEDLDPESNNFKEEVIVRAISQAGINQINNTETKSSFGKAISEIMYQFKQLLRKIFGKSIKISKLSPATTLNELADVLTKGDKITIDTQLVSEEDVVAYNKEAYDEVTQDLDSVRNQDIQNTINAFYDVVSSQINMLLKNENYEELASLLTDEYLRGDIQAMKSNLQAWQTTIKDAGKKLSEDISESRNRVEALTNSLFRLEDVMLKVYEHTKDVANQPDTQENMHKAHYYDEFIKHWSEFIDQVEEALSDPENDVPGRSPVTSLVADIKSNISKTKKLIDNMYADGARDALYEQLEPLNRNIAERYDQLIANLKEKNAPQFRIDSVFKEYHGMTEDQWNRFNQLLKQQKAGVLNVTQANELNKLAGMSQKGLSISKDKIEQLLKGQIGDANFFNSYLEGYLYNTDPVVGGLALYTKNALNEVMTASQKKYNEFATDIQDDLKAAGYNPNNVGKLGQDVGFRDKIAHINSETGEVEEREVWTLLNRFKNYRHDQYVLRKAVEDAHVQYQMTNSEEDRQVLVQAVAEQKRFLRDYFHQEYVDEFYDRQELFEKDTIGQEAAYRREEIFERMRKVTEPNKSQLDQLAVADDIADLWREYRQMHSRYDLNGKLKTGEELEIATRLREYREASHEFYEFKIRKGVFENAYFDFQQELKNQGVDEGSDMWNVRMNEWKKRNSRAVIKNEFYDRRNKILQEIEEIMSKVPEAERKRTDQGKVWEKILDLTAGFRDQDGQLNGSEMSSGSLATMKSQQELLEKIRKQPLSNTLSKWDKATLTSLFTELASMQTKEATEYYVDIVNNWLSKLNTTQLLNDYGFRTVDKTSAETLLNYNVTAQLKDQSSEFAEWFDANHVERTRLNPETGTDEVFYERLYAWNVTKPTDSNMMESYDIKDQSGNLIETIPGLPVMDYYARVVKTKYRTRNILGATKDNQGNFLPKTLGDGAKDDRFINKDYDVLRQENPELFKVLEKLTKHHLANQEGLSYRSRLYLDIPRYRKSNLEIVQTSTLREKAKGRVNALTLFAKRVKDFIHGAKDQAEDGFTHEERFNLVRADMFDNEMTDIPISGLYDIEADDVSTDVTLSMMKYMMSAERQKQLVKISPVVRAIQATVNNPEYAVQDLNRVNKKEFNNRGILSYLKKKKNVRQLAVNNFIEREFEGKTQTGLGSDTPFLNNFANLLFKRSSFAFFALNIPSALKNSMGMKFQEMIEASGGKYTDHISLQKGNAWAYKAMGDLSFNGQLYTKGPKTHTQQLVDIFDPVQGRFEKGFGQEMSRTMLKDAASISWLYSPREWVQIQAGIQLFGGMMYKKKVIQTLPDGSTQEIPYLKAFETVDGQIRLKEGIDKRYAPEPIQYMVKSGDTLESIAATHNIPVSEIENAFRGVEISEVLEKAKEIEEERQDELDQVDLTKAEDEAERTKMMDKITAINNKYDKKAQEKGSIKINNGEFKFMKNQIQQVQNNMGGAYSKFDQPEAQRYLAFRFISYLRRYFTTMAINRWGFSGPLLDPKPRLNPGLGDVQMGFYIQFGKTIAQTIRNGGKNIPYMTQEEKSAMLRFGTEVGMLMTTLMLASLLFGWDPEDDERYVKLRAKSGALGFLGLTADDPDREFDLLGYMELHSLHLLMQVRAENEQFNLLTGGLKQYNSLLDIKSVVFGPTTDSYVQLWDDLKKTATGDPKAYYSRKVGPYEWQEQGGSKFLNHFAKTFGLTGSSLDPALAIQNFQSYQSKVRR